MSDEMESKPEKEHPEDVSEAGTLATGETTSSGAVLVSEGTTQPVALETAIGDSGVTTGAAEAQPLPAEPGTEDRGLGAGALEEGAEVPVVPAEGPAVPPAAAMQGAPIFSEASFALPGPTQGLPGAEALRQAEELQATEELVNLFVTDERMRELWNRASKAKTAVDTQIQSLQIARQLLDEIKSARNELLNGKTRYEDAERFINEIEFQVDHNEKVRRWSYTIGLGLFFYELVWAVGVVIFLVVTLGSNAFAPNQSDFTYWLASAVWGVLGGVTGAWFALVKHISQDQDFESQHSMWYVLSPLMGAGVGAVTYLILRLGLLSVAGATGQSISYPYIIYLIAWLGGYQHNIFTDMVKRVLKVLETGTST